MLQTLDEYQPLNRSRSISTHDVSPCFSENYLITVEFKKSWKNLTKYIRVYLNWDCDIPQGSKIKTKVRIAGKSHSSLISSTQNYLDVVEIPVDRKIADISVCSQTGNFAVAIDREVKVFHLVDKTVPSSGKTYRDVEIFLELCWNFRLVTLSLCEDYVVCSSQNEFQAVRLEYTDSDSESSRLNQIKSERKRYVYENYYLYYSRLRFS